MRRKNIILTVTVALLLCVLPLSAKAEYTPSLTLNSSLTLTQNRNLTNFELPTRTSAYFEINLTPLSFNVNKRFIFDVGLSFFSNSNSLAWNNTQLLGFYGLEGSVLLGGNIKRYQIKTGIGIAYNRYLNEDYYFLSLNGILNQSILISDHVGISLPFKFSFRQEVFDYRLGFGITYYPLGGAL